MTLLRTIFLFAVEPFFVMFAVCADLLALEAIEPAFWFPAFEFVSAMFFLVGLGPRMREAAPTTLLAIFEPELNAELDMACTERKKKFWRPEESNKMQKLGFKEAWLAPFVDILNVDE